MCTTCGCGNAGGAATGDDHLPGRHDHAHDHSHDHPHDHAHDHAHDHPHDHPHDHAHDHAHDHGQPPGVGPATRPPESSTGPRLIQLERDILEANNLAAGVNRERFAAAGVLAVNLVSSPGAGKTTLLVESIAAGLAPIAVIEGDQQTALDADRIRAAGAPAFQINTGRACHLDAAMVARAADHLGLPGQGGYLFIENVGNLVCPAAFDLGEAVRVLLVSVTEGDDKPLKYPDIFASATLAIVTKIDLLPHVRFDLEACLERARRINPAIETLALSADSGEGMESWFSWLAGRLKLACTVG